jgi:hypothetical protein
MRRLSTTFRDLHNSEAPVPLAVLSDNSSASFKTQDMMAAGAGAAPGPASESRHGVAAAGPGPGHGIHGKVYDLTFMIMTISRACHSSS